MLLDITDLTSFGKCAQCGAGDLHETLTSCPKCHYSLGRSNIFSLPSTKLSQPIVEPDESNPIDPPNQQIHAPKADDESPDADLIEQKESKPRSRSHKLRPPPIPDFCFIHFECKFENRLGCKIYGDGPAVVEWVEDVRMKMSPGIIQAMQGPYTTVLICRGLYPSIGDIIVTVDGVNVEHLSAVEVSVFLVH